ncbi:hypothetical protein VTJ04DRAFT_2487 [Mycothermus thermophilus]|uniref:uncharacterized protein n=1 Tax=Humicola insolens TaxID=85995 RepID=UPI00374482BF
MEGGVRCEITVVQGAFSTLPVQDLMGEESNWASKPENGIGLAFISRCSTALHMTTVKKTLYNTTERILALERKNPAFYLSSALS